MLNGGSAAVQGQRHGLNITGNATSNTKYSKQTLKQVIGESPGPEFNC